MAGLQQVDMTQALIAERDLHIDDIASEMHEASAVEVSWRFLHVAVHRSVVSLRVHPNDSFAGA
jgi:hypothetical protein